MSLAAAIGSVQYSSKTTDLLGISSKPAVLTWINSVETTAPGEDPRYIDLSRVGAVWGQKIRLVLQVFRMGGMGQGEGPLGSPAHLGPRSLHSW